VKSLSDESAVILSLQELLVSLFDNPVMILSLQDELRVSLPGNPVVIFST
jgi:hypothetical protein